MYLTLLPVLHYFTTSLPTPLPSLSGILVGVVPHCKITYLPDLPTNPPPNLPTYLPAYRPTYCVYTKFRTTTTTATTATPPPATKPKMQGPTVIPTPPKPPCLYRVTDSTSHTLPNHLSGDFDTGTQTGATWEDIISPLTLDRQLDGPDFHFHNVSEDDDNNDYESHLAKNFNSPLFVSTTTSAAWATSEHRRRLLKKRRRDVRTYKIDLHRFEWEYVELGKGIKFPILRSPGWECAVFSTDCATQGLNW